jgi:hypothetical protein
VGISPNLARTCLSAKAQRAKYDGARFSVGAREHARGVQPLCWGALGYVATARASTCRKRKHSTRRPARRQARRGERRTAPRRANTDEDHRRAPVAVHGCGLDLSAGVRTATTSSPTSLHKNSTARRPVHRFPRHGARARHTARRCGGAAWGGPRFTSTGCSTRMRSQERPAQQPGVATVRWRNKSGAGRRPFMGKRRRTGARRLEGLLTDMAKGRKRRKRRRGHDAHSGAEV